MNTYIKILSAFLILLLALPQCTPDDESENLYPAIQSGFSYITDATGTTLFTNLTTGGSTYMWDFGDGNTSSEASPVHYYQQSGTYTVTLTTTNVAGTTTIYTQEIVIVVEGFTYQTTDTAGGVSFTNETVNGVSYAWNFGDGNTSTEENPTHTYATGGTYTVTLTVTYPDGNVVTYTQEVMAVSCSAETMANAIDPANSPLYIGFKDGNSVLGGFGDMVAEVTTNPDFDEVNPTCNVYKYEKTTTAQSWSGVAVEGGLTSAFSPATQDGVITLKAYGANRVGNVTVRLEFEPYPNVDPSVEITQPLTATGEWQNLTFDFTAHADKTFKSMIVYVDKGTGFDGSVFYFDEIAQVEGLTSCSSETMADAIDPANSPLYIGFKDGNSVLGGFGDMVAEVVANPYFNFNNPSCYVYKYVKTTTAQSWSGVAVNGGLTTAIAPASQSGVIKLKAFGEDRAANVTVRLEFEPYPNVDPAVEITQPLTASGEWQELTFDFSAHTDKTFKSMIVYVDKGTQFDGAVFYIDEIRQVN